MNVSLIIAAAGTGKRFFGKRRSQGSPSKLFLNLAGKPLLAHALESFQGIPGIREIILAIPPGVESYVRNHILRENHLKKPIRLVRGGATRAESVWNALRRVSPRSQWVLVHDGARPFPPKEAIAKLFKRASRAQGVILARPVVSTLKRVSPLNGQVLATVDRTHLFEAQTPQLIRREVLLKAYKENPSAFLATDEASLVESIGGRVEILSHEEWNPKVTTPEDLRLAEAYDRGRSGLRFVPRGARISSPAIAVGLGRDTHRLIPGRPLYLGGIRIPFEKGSLGHSDGDALLHAISDAILGAAGLGDIGEWFPPTDPRIKNIRSPKMVAKILQKIHAGGWKVERLDTVITLERPSLAPFKRKIREKVARLLEVPPESISIKAKTLEGLGPEGEGRAVTCEALVLLRRFP